MMPILPTSTFSPQAEIAFKNTLQNLSVTAVSPEEKSHIYNKGFIPTSPVAGQLWSTGLANFSNKTWMEQVELASKSNGGMGNAEVGFLAWGEEGFFRFTNDTIPPELSARYAQISLLSGLPIESLKITNEYSEKHFAGKEEFATKFETGLQAFIQNPQVGFKVDGGGVIYTIAPSKDGEGFAFVKHKKKSWFGRVFEKVAKWAGPVFSFLGNIFPPLKLVSAGISVVNGFVQKDYASSVSKDLSKQGAAVP